MKKIIVSLLSIIILTTLVYAQQERRDGSKGKGMDRIIKNLNLSADQQKSLEDMRIGQKKKMIEIKADLEKAELDLEAIENKDNINKSEYLNQIEKLNSIRNKMSIERANHHLAFLEILTPEQRKEWVNNKHDRHQKREARMKDRMQKGERKRIHQK